MRKIYSIWFLLALLAFAACSPEEDDLFDKSAAERIDEAIKQDLSVLRGAKNGWVMEYYPSPTKMYGGYTFLVSFGEDWKANVMCDFFADGEGVKSEYEVKQSAGVMLTFDTYNEIFHFFSEPSNYLGIGEQGEGMEGDYEFLILECTPEKVVLKGKKTGNKMLMTPLPENEEWAHYMGTVKQIAKEAYPALYDVKVGENVEYTVTQRYHKFVLVNKDGSEKDLPFVYTVEGIKFSEPVTIGGQDVQSLVWDSETMAYANNNIRIVAQELPAGYKKYEELLGEYIFVYGDGNDSAPILLREELFNHSFIMEGFPMDIRVVFKADKGVIGIESQPLEGSVYLCPWALGASGSGPLTNMSGTGMVGQNLSNGSILLKDNGVWGNVADSFIAYDLASGSSIFQIAYVVGMIKQ